jgi:hypothetical protein
MQNIEWHVSQLLRSMVSSVVKSVDGMLNICLVFSILHKYRTNTSTHFNEAKEAYYKTS